MKKNKKNKTFTYTNAAHIPCEVKWAKMKKYNGLTTFPQIDIKIDPDLKDKELIEIGIHEITHSFWPEKTEREVTKFAATAARFLYFLGYRRLEDKGVKKSNVHSD